MRRKVIFIIVLIITIICVSLIPTTVGENDESAHIAENTLTESINVKIN